jgi:arginine-tRNA-protein transferase
MAPLFDEAHYRLYLRYQAARHPGGAMAQSSAEEYLDFLAHPDEGRTRFIEFRRSGLLLAVLVMDRLEEGASAVYTFFEPGPLGQGLGTYAVLWQIHWLLAQGLPYLYLGYWVKDSRTMGYKSGFRPYETLSDGVWLRGPSR